MPLESAAGPPYLTPLTTSPSRIPYVGVATLLGFLAFWNLQGDACIYYFPRTNQGRVKPINAPITASPMDGICTQTPFQPVHCLRLAIRVTPANQGDYPCKAGWSASHSKLEMKPICWPKSNFPRRGHSQRAIDL